MHDIIIRKLKNTIAIYTEGRAYAVSELNKEWNTHCYTYIKAYIGVIYLYFQAIKGPRKYIFQTLRNKEIIECLNPEDITVIGSRNEFFACKKQNYQFIWDGGIAAAVIVAARGGSTLPLRLQISLAKKATGRSRKYFFLYEDTLPIGIFLVTIANERPHVSICIEHGVHSTKEVLLEGLSCRYNLLYQLDHKEGLNGKSVCLELGPPFDVEVSNELSSSIILVGTGFQGLFPSFYRKSLDCYRKILNVFEKTGWRVVYRPHPSERPANYSSHFTHVDKSLKTTCLSGPRKIFIGYQSTLLYEAKVFGHSVIALRDPDVGQLKRFMPNKEMDAADIDDIESVVNQLHSEMRKTTLPKIAPLNQRFSAALKRIELCGDRA